MRPAPLATTLFLVVLASSGISTASASSNIKEGDLCGVISSDFLNDSFLGQYTVAGPTGCSLEDGAKSNCYCGPEIDGEERLGEWEWQCGDSITFGPVAPKQCPATVPVPLNNDSGLVEFMRDGGELNCDMDKHPSGHPGDEVCGYSDCEEGGDFSAVCACVDLSRMGIDTPQWYCLHSTCNCDADAAGDESDGNKDTSGACGSGKQVIMSAAAATAAAAAAAALAMLN